MKVVRAQTPDGNLKFGMYGGFDSTADASPPIHVKSFKVTAAE
jgi:hypothetical protein